jgi:hypothetical protein
LKGIDKMSKLEEACLLSCEEWVNSFECETDYQFSKAFEKKIDVLFDKMRNDRYHRFTRRTARALIIVAIILSFATTVFAIPTTREYIIKKFSNHSTYAVVDSSNFENVEDLRVEYVPNGFEKSNELISDSLINVDYEYGEKWFSISKNNLDAEINFDTESNEYEKITDNDISYIVHNSNDKCCEIIWNNGQNIYTINGNILKEELLKIATNVE